jgi:hypothetical protein
LLTGAEAEGSDIPAAVPMQNLTPQVLEVAEGAPERMEETIEEAAVATGGEKATVPPEAALEVVVRSPEIQDAEPIRSAPMTEAATSSRGGVELLADDLVDPHEVGVFSELGDDLPGTNSLGLACDRCDRHEALLRGSVYSALDRFESFREVTDGEIVSETSAPFAVLPVTLTSSVSVGGVSSAGALADSSSEEMSSRYLS